jgi:hypothetical protein
MTRLYSAIIFTGLILLCSSEALAQVASSFTKLFRLEQYNEALSLIEPLNEKQLHPAKKSYLLGLCSSRLRKYEDAILHFSTAIKKGAKDLDLNYEYGQAFFANNNLAQAREEFKKSAAKNFNYIASVYYVAHISEILEDDVAAKHNYRLLIKYKKIDKRMLQVALFQYTKILLKMMKREEASLRDVEIKLAYLDINLINHIPRYIIPLLQKAMSIDPVSTLAPEIREFTKTLMDEFKLDPNVMKNGRKISEKKLYASISQSLKFDDNVELSEKSSMIYKTDAFAKYDFVANKRIIFSPEIRFSYLKHKDQITPEIYQYDSYSLAPAARVKLEHTYNGKPASLFMDLEYNTVYRDWKMSHNKEYYSKSTTFGLGEQVSFSNSDETYFNFRRTNYENETGFGNYKITSVSTDHYAFMREGSQLLIGTLDLSLFDYYESPALNYNIYTARMIYLIFDFVPTYTFQLILSGSLTDTKLQKEERGNEINLNPSFEITKAFSSQTRLSVNYNYLKNSSKQEEYKYQKQIIGTSLSYTF